MLLKSLIKLVIVLLFICFIFSSSDFWTANKQECRQSHISLIRQKKNQITFYIQQNLWIAALRNEDILQNKDTSSGAKLLFKCKLQPEMRTPLNKGHFQLVPNMSLFHRYHCISTYFRNREFIRIGHIINETSKTDQQEILYPGNKKKSNFLVKLLCFTER
jgi:hypothetical protein